MSELRRTKAFVVTGLWVVFAHLFLSGDKVPVVHQPGFELFWDFYLYFHAVGKHFLLDARDSITVKKRELWPVFCQHGRHGSNLFEMLIIANNLVAHMNWKQELGRGTVSPAGKKSKEKATEACSS